MIGVGYSTISSMISAFPKSILIIIILLLFNFNIIIVFLYYNIIRATLKIVFHRDAYLALSR